MIDTNMIRRKVGEANEAHCASLLELGFPEEFVDQLRESGAAIPVAQGALRAAEESPVVRGWSVITVLHGLYPSIEVALEAHGNRAEKRYTVRFTGESVTLLVPEPWGHKGPGARTLLGGDSCDFWTLCYTPSPEFRFVWVHRAHGNVMLRWIDHITEDWRHANADAAEIAEQLAAYRAREVAVASRPASTG